MEGKKREWRDRGRFSGSEKPHLVLNSVQGCCSWPPWGSPWDLSPSVETFGGSIQMWSRCEWQEKGKTTSLSLPAVLGVSSRPWGHPSRPVPCPGCPQARAESWSWFRAIYKLDEMQPVPSSRPSGKPLHRKQRCIKELVLHLRRPVGVFFFS